VSEDAPDWLAWHSPYLDPSSSLSRRLGIIQEHITDWLNQRPGVPLTAVSICAGQGHDLIGVLAHRADAHRVHATLLEYDERNVAAARAAAETAGLADVLVRQADAGDPAAYRGAVPADLVLLAGVFGNIDDADISTTIAALPQLCSRAATVIWTRSRRPPDRTGAIRAWLAEAGFAEVSFTAPPDDLFSVGVHQLTASPEPLTARTPLFRFTRS
jgi:hypothetical protein